jgi:SH3-like domain-containing protein
LPRGLSGIIALGDVIEKDSTRWQRVVTPRGRQGWVNGDFLVPDQDGAPVLPTTTLDQSFTNPATLPTATPDQAVANSMTLPKVKLNTYHVDKCNILNVRTDPDSRSQIVVRLDKGVNGIILFGDVVTNGSTRWQKVITPAGQQGWVNIDFLVPDQDATQ